MRVIRGEEAVTSNVLPHRPHAFTLELRFISFPELFANHVFRPFGTARGELTTITLFVVVRVGAELNRQIKGVVQLTILRADR